MHEGMNQLVALLAIAMLVAVAARRYKLPYTIGLVGVGVLLAVSKSEISPMLTPELIFDLILPPLLFEGALAIHWNDLRRNIGPVLILSTVGTIVTMAAVAGGLIAFMRWTTGPALVFGALIAATDPVAIIAMFKDYKLKGRLALMVESESLFNDGVAAVLFVMALAWAQPGDHAPTALETLLVLGRVALGGILVGGAAAAAMLFVAGRITEHLIEATLTTILAFGSFLTAEHFGASGVLATVTAGLVVGNARLFAGAKPFLTDKGQEFVAGFWEFGAFLANSVVFLLIGANVAVMPYQTYGALALAGAIGLTLLGRAAAVYPLCLLFRGSRNAISMIEQHVLWWGGLRGALGLALALSIPRTLPLRDEIVVLTFGVVAFSIVAQGLTMPLLLRRLKPSQQELPLDKV